MQTKPHIIILTDIYWPSKGGVEESIRSLSSALVDHYDISIISHANSNKQSSLLAKTLLLSSFQEYHDDIGNRVMPLIPNLLQRFFMLPFCIWQIPLLRRLAAKKLFDFLYRFYRSAFKQNLLLLIKNADIVHNFSTGYLAILGTEVCNENSIPIVSAPPVHFGKWGDSEKQLRAYCNSTALICPTEIFKKEIIKRVSNISAQIVINPPLSSPSPDKLIPPVILDEKKPFILFLGRREKYKGLAILLDAHSQIEHMANLVIAGPGKEIISPSTSCIELGKVSEDVKHWLLSHCTIFCVPSTNESFGMVYVEAMSYDRPIVAIDIPPVNEIIIHNKTGLLIQPENCNALVEALTRLLKDRALRKRFGKSAGKHYRVHYSQKQLVQAIDDVYRDILKGK